MASRFGRFTSFTRKLFGNAPPRRFYAGGSVGKQFVQLEDRCVPATFVVTNILDNQTDVVGGLSLRQAIEAANANPGFDRIVFNIPRSPSLPTIPNDPTENYFPIVLASTLPDLTDPAGVEIDATTQPRNDTTDTRPIVQLLPDPNPGAFPGSKGAFYISGQNNVIRGFVITGFPGSAINITGPNASSNIIIGNWINTDITGTEPWSQDPIILAARPPGTPPELTNTGPLPNQNPLFVTGGITLTDGASSNIIGGVIDATDQPLADAGGDLIGTGGILSRFDNDPTSPTYGELVSTGIAITPAVNRNIISGTPEFKKSYYDYLDPTTGATQPRADDADGAGVGPGIRIQDPNTDYNLIQDNFIGTDVTGTEPIPNHNGIEIFNAASGNMIGNPTSNFTGDPVLAGIGNLIRFNANDGVRLADTPSPSQVSPPPPPGPPTPYQEGYDFYTTTKTIATPQGPFGPINEADTFGTVFFDSLNPDYFHGASPTNPNIITVDTDDPSLGETPGITAQVGSVIKIRGTGLSATTAVTFNSSATIVANPQTVTASFVVVSDGELDVTVPDGAVTSPLDPTTGLYEYPSINVFTPAGTDTLPDYANNVPGAVILPAPPAQIEIVSTFAPSSGTAGSTVQIFGTNFVGVESVSFGGILATQFTVEPGNTEIDAIVPTGAKTGDITVTTPGGAATTTRQFIVDTQPPPVVTAISAASAVPGQQITLSGADFIGTYAIRFDYSGGSSGFTTTNLTVNSTGTQITVNVPLSSTASSGPIEVVSNDGFGVSTSSLQIVTPAAPVYTSQSLSSGPIGSTITITGANFTSVKRVTFSNTLDAQSYTIVNDNTITAVVPNGLAPNTTSQIRLVSLGGTTLAGTYTITPSAVPTVQAIPFANRYAFTVVNGTNLLGTTKVLFGNATTGTPAVSFQVISSTEINVQIPASVAASGTFYVYTAYNTQNPLAAPASATFAVSNNTVPTIDTGRQTAPISGVIGSTVTLNGTGFLGTQNVFFTAAGGGTVAATNLKIINDQQMTFTVPQFAVSGPVTVDTPGVPDTLPPFDGSNTTVEPLPEETTSVDFTVLPSPVPTIITPGFFPVTGPIGTVVTLSGTGFLGTVQVTVGGGIVDKFQVLSDNVIKFTVPILATSGPITVVTNGGTATSSINYTVTDSPVPTITYSTPTAAQNTQVTIAGTGLAGTAKVTFNDVSAQFTVIDDTTITATVPLTAGPGVIQVYTAGGVATSPTPFNLAVIAPPVIGAVGELQASETSDAGPVGTKIEINSSSLGSVYEVDFATPYSAPGSGTAADFTTAADGNLLITVPELAAGEYEVRVFSATNSADGTYTAGADSSGTNTYWDSSYSRWTNIIGTTYTYGELFDVEANARPVITDISPTDSTDFERGVPIEITGSGFTGANDIRIYTDFANDKFIDITNSPAGSGEPPLFTVVSDTEITMNIPISELSGTGAIDGAVIQVFTPNGVVGDASDDLGSDVTDAIPLGLATIDIAATPTLAFSDASVEGATYGSTITLIATAGNFYGVTSFVSNSTSYVSPPSSYNEGDLGQDVTSQQPFPISDPEPFDPTTQTLFQNFQIVAGTNGTEATVVIPTDFAPIPTPTFTSPPNTPAIPVPPPGAQIVFTANTNAGTTDATMIPPVALGGGIELLQPAVGLPDPSTPTISSIASSTGVNDFNIAYTITGNLDLISTEGILIAMSDGSTAAVSIDNIEVAEPTPGVITLTFIMPVERDPNDPHTTDAYPTGALEVVTTDGVATTTVTFAAATYPSVLIFATPTVPPIDNQIVANRIFDNGQILTPNATSPTAPETVTPKTQAQIVADGDQSIDFVTGIPSDSPYRTNNAPGAYDPNLPFWYGYAYPDQGPPNAPPAGNNGLGGINDGEANSFELPPAQSVLPTDPDFDSQDLTSGADWAPGQNTFNNTQYGRYFGPNLLQNFPLLQEVQSTVDGTTFSTALLGKPDRTYRIDYYYDPGTDNPLTDSELDPFLSSQSTDFTGTRYDSQDPTARATTDDANGQIYLGSKIITTDAEGNGSVSFFVPVLQPGQTQEPGDFELPNNQPLTPSVIDPVTGDITFDAGVVTSTATDLTAPGPDGPEVQTGPDGTSRMSFFKRVDTPTGSISGNVIIDKNADGIIESNEQGLAGATVSLYVQQQDGTYTAEPNATATITSEGSYFFGPSSTGGYGLGNGTDKLVLTLPTGGTQTYYYETPASGTQYSTIINGQAITNVNFLVTTAPTNTNTPPTISAIPTENTPVSTAVGPIHFTVGDAQTPAASLVVTATSSNTGVIPASGIALGGSGADRTITLTPAAGIQGSSTITVTVTDGGGLSTSTIFTVNVGVPATNTPPTISSVPDENTTPGATVGPLTFTIGDAETPVGSLIVSATSSNTNVVPSNDITLGGSGANRTVTISTPLGITGTSTITLTVTDGGGLTATDSFTVTVPPPPGTAPSLLAIGTDAGTTAQVKVYSPDGSFRFEITPYGTFSGGVRVSTGDVTGDGNADIVVAPGPGMPGLVKIYDGVSGSLITQFLPYGATFSGGVYVTLGDVDGDGIDDIVTGTGKGGGPRVRVIKGGETNGVMTLTGLDDFFAYESSFRGGVLVAAGDVNGDGHADIVTGTGVGGGPRVRVLDGTNLTHALYDFFAYESTFRGGVFASVGDVTGDGIADIVTGTGVGGGPVVKVFQQSTLANHVASPAADKSFTAYDPSYRGGVRVDLIDANGDGVADIVTGPGAGLAPDVRVIDYATLQDIYRIQAFNATFLGGVYVGSNLT